MSVNSNGLTADMNNYPPVSNLSFMSKLIERVVANQLNEYLSANELLPRFQSERAIQQKKLCCESGHMLMAADARKVTLLGVLDMLAAFRDVVLESRTWTRVPFFGT